MVNDDDSQADDLSAALSEVLADEMTGSGDEGTTGGAEEGLGGDLDLSALEEAVAELGLEVDQDEPPAAPPAPAPPAPPPPPPAAPPATQATEDDGGGAPMTFEIERDDPTPTPNPGLDLTELPPPPGGAGPAASAGGQKKLPPLGEATADDLFGPIDDDPGLPTDWEPDEPAAATPPPPPPPPPSPDLDDLPPPPPSAEPEIRGFEEPPAVDDSPSGDAGAGASGAADPVQLPAPDPGPPVTADPAMADVVGFTAHGGAITGNIRDKAKRLFGRGDGDS